MSRSVGEFTLVGHLGEGSFATVGSSTFDCPVVEVIAAREPSRVRSGRELLTLFQVVQLKLSSSKL